MYEKGNTNIAYHVPVICLTTAQSTMSSCIEGACQSNGQIWPWIAAATLITSIPWVLLLAMCVANAVIVYRRCSVKRGIFVKA